MTRLLPLSALLCCSFLIPSLHAEDNRTINLEQALEMKPMSVTDNALVPPSGDKRDYYSSAPYFWPDPTKKDGKPYIRRDGEVNPESRGVNSDYLMLRRTISAIDSLNQSYQKSKNEAHAKKAAEIIRRWFLDPKSGMRPHMKYAQGVPGVSDGRCYGIIESYGLIRIGLASTVFLDSPHWSKKEDQKLRQWFEEFLVWLRDSPLGQEERSRSNNHGTCYDLQFVLIARYLGKDELVRQVLNDVKVNRIAAQISPVGRQPDELKRTNSLGYSIFNLRFLMDLADIAEDYDVDLWHYRSEEGGSIQKALDYLLPYIGQGKEQWPYQQISRPNFERLAQLYERGGEVYDDDRYRKMAKRLRKPQEW